MANQVRIVCTRSNQIKLKMPQDDDDGDTMMWMDEEPTAEEPETTVSDEKDPERVAKLEAELARTRTELSDVRRELAAKVMHAHAWQIRSHSAPCQTLMRVPPSHHRLSSSPGESKRRFRRRPRR